jgi:hypothetical protein
MTVDFTFLLEQPGDIVFKNSGGPDCAILIYYAAKFVSEHKLNIKFYHVSVDTSTKFFYVKHAKLVIQYIFDMFGVECSEHAIATGVDVVEIENIDGTFTIYGYKESQRKLISDLRVKYPNIKYEVCGTSNMLPPDILAHEKLVDDTLRYTSGCKDIDRTGTITFPKMKKEVNSLYWHYSPLVNSDKRDVKQLYDEAGCIDSLFPLTRSCEISTTSSRYSLVQSGHCGRCIFCFERKYVFGKL